MPDIRRIAVNAAYELGMDLAGVADAAAVNRDAPEGFRPMDHLPGAKSVIIIAQRMPKGSICSAEAGGDILFMRSFWNSAQILDAASQRLALLLENRFGYRSIPLPTYSPVRLHEGKPRGVISLKHTARIAGLGGIGKNSLLINPKLGNRLRLSGVLTEAPLAADRPFADDPCPQGCDCCVRACPVGAIGDRSVDIIMCMKKSIRHPMMQPYWSARFLLWLSKKSRGMHRFIEDLNNMMMSNYAEACSLCLVACPYFKK